MKIPDKIGYKAYFLFFGWLCFGELGLLIMPTADSCLYYQILKAFYPPAGIYYYLAIIRAVINIACLLPLYFYAFEKPQKWLSFFKILLCVRLITDITGHNYEWQSVKSLFYIKPFLPFCAIGVWLGTNFLAYKAHYNYIYKPLNVSKPSVVKP